MSALPCYQLPRSLCKCRPANSSRTDPCYQPDMKWTPAASKRGEPAESTASFATALFTWREDAGIGAPLQPGLLPLFRLFVLVTAITPAIAWGLLTMVTGVRCPVLGVVLPESIFAAFLLIYTPCPSAITNWGARSFPSRWSSKQRSLLWDSSRVCSAPPLGLLHRAQCAAHRHTVNSS